MKIEKAKELIKKRGNESVGDTCDIPRVLPFPKRNIPERSSPHPMAERELGEADAMPSLPIPDGPSARNLVDPTLPRIPNYNRRTTVPTAYKVIYRPKEGGGYTEERIPVHPIRTIGFTHSGHMGATEEV